MTSASSTAAIAAVGPDLEGSARETVDATGLHVFPGVVDAHVHCNDPGRSDWEGFAHGTAALAAGGTTTFVDMPLNASPPTVDGASFDLKVAAATDTAVVDFALWGGLVPGDVDRLDELADRGVVGFKAFMCPTGMDDFRAADDDTLHAGMARAARLGLPVAVHAESAELTTRLAAQAVSEGRTTMRDYLASRPVVAELEAIERAIAIAEETGCSLHVVHVSTGSGVRLVGAAREARGVDVTCETCPHYLALDDEDARGSGHGREVLAAAASACRARRPLGHAARGARRPRRVGSLAEPARAQARRRRVRRLGRDRRLPDAAAGAADGGPATRALARDDREPLRRGARAAVRARRARARSTPAQTQISCWSTWSDESVLTAAELLSLHRLSPFIGRRLRGRVVRTILRGSTVCLGGDMVASPGGRFVRPILGRTMEARS